MACVVLVVWVMSLAAQTPASLRIEVLEGQGSVFQPGSLSYKGFTVRVTDATGQPAAGIPVRFSLPSAEPTGLFPNGNNSEVQVSDAQGKASVWGIRWGAGTGVARVAIAAGSGAVTAGLVLPVRIGSGNAPVPALPPPAPVAPAADLTPTPAAPTPVAPAPLAAEATSRPEPVSVQPPPHSPPPSPSLRTVAPAHVEASFEVPVRSVFPAPATPVSTSPEPSTSPSPAGGNSLVESRGVIFTRNVGPAERFPSTGGRRKWVAVSLGVAGAIGGGMAYRMLNKPGATPQAAAVTTTPPAPALSLSAPIITVAKP